MSFNLRDRDHFSRDRRERVRWSARTDTRYNDPIMIPLIDCHMHLQEPVLRRDLQGVLDRAAAAGVRYLICNGTMEQDWPIVAKLAGHDLDIDGHPIDPADSPNALECDVRVIPCFGLHPWYVTERSNQWLDRLEQFLAAVPSAVGEIGLDRWKEPRDEPAQEKVFLAQLDLARRLDRPVMIHCLRAWGWFMGLMRAMTPLPRGMLIHAYGGPADLIDELAAMGVYFSFAGSVMEDKRTKAREALCAVPLDRLLIETDAPDMLPPDRFAPFGVRDDAGNRVNEPANLSGVLKGVAQARSMSDQSLAGAVWANARRFFGELVASGDEQ